MGQPAESDPWSSDDIVREGGRVRPLLRSFIHLTLKVLENIVGTNRNLENMNLS